MHAQDTHSQNMTRIAKNIEAGRDPIMGIGSMPALMALFAHDMPADTTPVVKSALEARLAKYQAQGKSDKAMCVKLTEKALAHFTPAPTPAALRKHRHARPKRTCKRSLTKRLRSSRSSPRNTQRISQLPLRPSGRGGLFFVTNHQAIGGNHGTQQHQHHSP